MVEMRSRATNEDTKRNDGVELLSLRELLGHHWHLKAPRALHYRNVVARSTVADQSIDGSFDQTVGEEPIPAARYDSKALTLSLKEAFYNLYTVDCHH